MSILVLTSNQISLFIQFITGIIGLYGLSIPLAQADIALREVLILEMIVQTIEFIFYVGFLSIFNIISLTQARYYDWFLSTPIMLFTTSLYFYYKNFIEDKQDPKDEKDGKRFGIVEFFKKDYQPILMIVVLNFLMLLFGFLAELGMMNRTLAFILGTFSLFGSFSIIYKNYAQFSKKTETIFYIMFGLWSCYGIFFMFPPVVKNIGYTTLDIFAKNFFGIFLAYVISLKKLPVTV